MDIATSIAVNGTGIYVTGSSSITGSGTGFDYATIKYGGDVQQWVSRYNGPGNSDDYTTSIALNGADVYVTGYSIGSGTGQDYATIKYSSFGVQEWVQRYNGPGNSSDYANSIAVDISGNAYVTGCSRGSGANFDYATIKYSSSGAQEWVQRYNGPGNSSDYANSIAVDGSGNVYVTGGSLRSGTGEDYTTIKYNSAGVQQWIQIYNGPGNSSDIANSLALDGSGNVYVTGGSLGSGTGSDYATIRFVNPPAVGAAITIPAADPHIVGTGTGSSVSFAGIETGGVGPYTYEWDYEYPGVFAQGGITGSHAYGTLGSFTAAFRVTDSVPTSDIDTITILVYDDGGTPSDYTDDSDQDLDGLPDGWEIHYFNDFDEVATGDPDGDGSDNAAEYAVGTDPTVDNGGGGGKKKGSGEGCAAGGFGLGLAVAGAAVYRLCIQRKNHR